MTRYRYSLSDDSTPAKAGAQIYVYMPGTTNKIPDTIYADATSNITLANPFTATSKKATFFLAAERRVSIAISTGSGQMHTTDPVGATTASSAVTGMVGPGGKVSGWIPSA